MTVMAEQRRTGQRPGAQQPPPRTRRTIELWLVGIGMALSLLGLGGFTLVMNQADQATFESVIMPTLLGPDPGMSAAEAYEFGRTLAAWFGITLITMLLLSVIGIFFTRRRPWRRSPGWWFLAAGLVCLLGSQLILFPVAFVFFVAAGCFALRPTSDGSHS